MFRRGLSRKKVKIKKVKNTLIEFGIVLKNIVSLNNSSVFFASISREFFMFFDIVFVVISCKIWTSIVFRWIDKDCFNSDFGVNFQRYQSMDHSDKNITVILSFWWHISRSWFCRIYHMVNHIAWQLGFQRHLCNIKLMWFFLVSQQYYCSNRPSVCSRQIYRYQF